MDANTAIQTKNWLDANTAIQTKNWLDANTAIQTKNSIGTIEKSEGGAMEDGDVTNQLEGRGNEEPEPVSKGVERGVVDVDSSSKVPTMRLWMH